MVEFQFIFIIITPLFEGSRDGAVVKPLASHQCGLGSNPTDPASNAWIKLRPCSEGSPDTPVFLPSQKPTLLNSNSIWDPRATGLSVASDTLVKQNRFI